LAGIFASIRLNLAGLFRFSGRETRGEFWPYAIFLFLLSMAVGIVVAGFVMADMFVRLQRYIAVHPEGLPTPVPGQPAMLPPELTPDLTVMTVPSMVANVVIVLLLAAAVVRRLHDRDRTGLWGLLPLPFTIVSMINRDAAMAQAMGQREPSRIELLMFMTVPLFWLALIVLIVLLAGEGSRGPNRFGPDPASPP
jgi:uncharacterized membrane protein YhaH (DUF805 family)